MSKILLMQEKLGKKTVSNLLESNGYNVLEATNASLGYKIAQFEKPDLILLDLHINDIEEYAADQFESIAPVICISSPFMRDRIDKGKEFNCIGHIAKPIRPEELINAVVKSLAAPSNKEKEFDMDTGVETVLVVDDIDFNIKLLESLLFPMGYQVLKAASGPEAIEVAKSRLPDLILLDVMMPSMNGFEVCNKLREDPITAEIPVIFVSALDSVDDKVKAFESGGNDYITKPFYHSEVKARVNSALKLKRLQDSLKVQNKMLVNQNSELETSEHIILSLIGAVEAKSAYLEGHTKRVSEIAVNIGKILGISSSDMHVLKQSAILHDIGKIGIPDNILNKNESLTEEEFDIIKQHSVIGQNILSPLNNLSKVKQIVRHHHEKLDGSGYPDKISGDEIDLLTRILSVSDVFDALTSDRPYREKLSMFQAIEILLEEAEKGWWDIKVIYALMEFLESKAEEELCAS